LSVESDPAVVDAISQVVEPQRLGITRSLSGQALSTQFGFADRWCGWAAPSISDQPAVGSVARARHRRRQAGAAWHGIAGR
jgi:hypothetical protein